MEREAKVIITGRYKIKEEFIRDSTYGDKVKALLEEGKVDEAFEAALEYDRESLVNNECDPTELFDWDLEHSAKIEWA